MTKKQLENSTEKNKYGRIATIFLKKIKERYLEFEGIIQSSDEVIVGEQDLPPQNVSLGCRLFSSENNQGPQDSGRNSDPPLSCLNRNLDGGPITGMEQPPEREVSEECGPGLREGWVGCGWAGNLLGDLSPLCVPSPLLAQQTLVYHLCMNCFPPP